MKKLILPVVAMLLCMTACKKEENGILRLEVEHYNSDAKMHIDSEDFAVWDNNDVVYLNGQETAVSISGTTATIAVPEGVSAPYYASYPYQATSANGSYTITLPAEQTYRKNTDGQQILDAPMAAYSADGNKLKFRNICSILALKVIPSSSATTKVLRIEVSANQPLWGDISFQNDLNSDPYTLSSCTNGGNTVTLMCNNENVPSTGKIFNIALPEVSDATFTIKVYTEENFDIYSYTRTQSGSISFDKNTIHEVPFTLNTDERTSLGLFSIDDISGYYYYYVSFAPGNYQYYNISGSNASDPWTYKTSQSYSDCDLFAWNSDRLGGRSIYGPDGYQGGGRTGCGSYDAGEYSYLLGKDEWQYVFCSRTNSLSFNGTGMYQVLWVRANVNNLNGVILFPDGNVTLTVVGKNLSATATDYTTNTFTADEWNNVFKPAGCVFLPALGYRYNGELSAFGENCCYWSSTGIIPSSPTAIGNACRVRVKSSDDPSFGNVSRTNCFPVRLAKER